MENQNQAGGFTPPTGIGNAELPKSGGLVNQKSTTKAAAASVKENKRNIKVVAIAKGWFDCKRIVPGTKFMVSAQEFSEKWMEKI